jgi:hypothetical protein
VAQMQVVPTRLLDGGREADGTGTGVVSLAREAHGCVSV